MVWLKSVEDDTILMISRQQSLLSIQWNLSTEAGGWQLIKISTWLNFSVKKVSSQILIEDIFGAYFVFFSMKRMRSDDIVSAGRLEYIES